MLSMKSIFLLSALASMINVNASGIPNIPQCNSCFNNLPKGCTEKVTNSRTNSLAAQSAYQDCLCTKQYINNFMNCATCSAKSMNSDQLPTEKDRNDAIIQCASNGFPIPDSIPGTSSTQSQNGSNSGFSVGNKPGPTFGPLSNQVNAAPGKSADLVVVSGVAFMGLKFVNSIRP